jgi:hypothetical protein
MDCESYKYEFKTGEDKKDKKEKKKIIKMKDVFIIKNKK